MRSLSTISQENFGNLLNFPFHTVYCLLVIVLLPRMARFFSLISFKRKILFSQNQYQVPSDLHTDLFGALHSLQVIWSSCNMRGHRDELICLDVQNIGVLSLKM